jgi:hypothetical protein
MLIASCVNIGPKKEGKNNEHEHLLLYANRRRRKKAFEEKRCASSFVDQTGCYF